VYTEDGSLLVYDVVGGAVLLLTCWELFPTGVMFICGSRIELLYRGNVAASDGEVQVNLNLPTIVHLPIMEILIINCKLIKNSILTVSIF
jgi:hypothetical protein